MSNPAICARYAKIVIINNVLIEIQLSRVENLREFWYWYFKLFRFCLLELLSGIIYISKFGDNFVNLSTIVGLLKIDFFWYERPKTNLDTPAVLAYWLIW